VGRREGESGNSTESSVARHKTWQILKSQLYSRCEYGVATIGRLLEILGLFCKKALEKRPYSANETYNFKEPTNRSHPIVN